nr:hypothetical protein GCM10020092_059950 [Actinoplanes digitatis]
MTFGGNVTAPVSSATPTSLTVEVPATAATGAIRVAAGGSTADSAAFRVLPGGPEITAMTPASGSAGTEVTLTGRNFDSTLGNDVVTLGGQAVNLVSATATTLRFRVPDGATGGRVQVASPRGTATSAADFFVPPATVDPATIESYARAEIGRTATVRIDTAGKVAVLLFDAPAGQNLSIGVSDIAASFGGAVGVRVISPDGLDVPDGEDARTASFDLDLRGLRSGQTYALVIDPRIATGTGSLSVSFSEPLGAEVTATGDAVTTTTTLPGQDVQLAFDANEGDAVSLGFTGNNLPNTAEVYVAGPTGEPVGVRWTLSARTSKSLDIAALPMNGAYRVVIDEGGAALGSITSTLSRWASAERGDARRRGADRHHRAGGPERGGLVRRRLRTVGAARHHRQHADRRRRRHPARAGQPPGRRPGRRDAEGASLQRGERVVAAPTARRRAVPRGRGARRRGYRCGHADALGTGRRWHRDPRRRHRRGRRAAGGPGRGDRLRRRERRPVQRSDRQRPRPVRLRVRVRAGRPAGRRPAVGGAERRAGPRPAAARSRPSTGSSSRRQTRRPAPSGCH